MPKNKPTRQRPLQSTRRNPPNAPTFAMKALCRARQAKVGEGQLGRTAVQKPKGRQKGQARPPVAAKAARQPSSGAF